MGGRYHDLYDKLDQPRADVRTKGAGDQHWVDWMKKEAESYTFEYVKMAQACRAYFTETSKWYPSEGREAIDHFAETLNLEQALWYRKNGQGTAERKKFDDFMSQLFKKLRKKEKRRAAEIAAQASDV